MTSLALHTVVAKSAPADNRETQIVAALLIEESRTLPDVIRYLRSQYIEESTARQRLVAHLVDQVKAVLPLPHESFIDGCICCALEHADWARVAALVCQTWTPEAIERFDAEVRDDAETQIKALEREEAEQDGERFDNCF